MCGSLSEWLVVLVVLVVILLIHNASRFRASRTQKPEQQDDGIRVQFLDDDDDKT